MSAGIRAGTSNDGYIQVNGVDRISITSSAISFNGNVSFTNNPNLGQCRFQFTSSSVCTLVPFQGNLIGINGVNYVIPTAGVTIAPTGLTPGTLYYVYAWMNGTTMTLEASTTGHSRDTSTGIEIKTGDPTRTLVGMVQPTTGPVFQGAGSTIYVLSWFNRRPLRSIIPLSGVISTTASTLTEIDTSYRALFLSWASVNISASITGGMTSTAVSTVQCAGFINGAATTGTLDGGCIATIPTIGYYSTLSITANISGTNDGQNYIALYGATAAGAVSILGSGSIGIRSTIQVITQG
jgi:hypothetical protein